MKRGTEKRNNGYVSISHTSKHTETLNTRLPVTPSFFRSSIGNSCGGASIYHIDGPIYSLCPELLCAGKPLTISIETKVFSPLRLRCPYRQCHRLVTSSDVACRQLAIGVITVATGLCSGGCSSIQRQRIWLK
ncbi:uncharacterized protein LOC18110501 isoform X2 [Populus trichocarpa]|uniref:uncharacterized protein LOC18110501 isoform X2 n=1 Tax=Populus trichocarpa TaxID=3694 RepID=UPI00227777A7|nr:uncharacterized protein LOC18110501 isoform X2 [Populus trichocarpa]